MFRIKLRVIVAIALCPVTTISAEQPDHPLVTQHERQPADRPILSVENLEGIDWSKVACTTMMDRAQLAGLALECHRTGRNLKGDIRRRYAICEWLPECLDFLNLIKCPVSAREAMSQFEMVRPLDLYIHTALCNTTQSLASLRAELRGVSEAMTVLSQRESPAQDANSELLASMTATLTQQTLMIRAIEDTLRRSTALQNTFREKLQEQGLK